MFPPLGSKDLIRLGEDWLHVDPVYRKERGYSGRDKHVSSISDVISRSKTTMDLSSEETTELAETFRKVPLPRQMSSQGLTLLVVRPFQDLLPRVSVRTRGRDF